MEFWIALLPIVFLVTIMTKKNPVASHIALPLTALLVYLIRLLFFGGELNQTHAAVLKGALSALTPLSIIWGAILLSGFMESSGKQTIVNNWLNRVSRNRVAQLMLIGWAFTFMLEGASGFGTPAAIAAPILVALGFPALRVAILTLIMNTVPVSFGAVGTPTWFGFAPLGLDEATLLDIGFKAAIVHFIAAFAIPLVALAFVLPIKEIRSNLIFVLLSVLSCTLPFLLLARVNYEFPSLVGGGIGIALTAALAKWNVGLSKSSPSSEDPDKVTDTPVHSLGEIVRAFSPFILLMLILVVTRVPVLGLRQLLTLEEPSLSLSLGYLGIAEISASLVLALEQIFRTEISWEYATLFVPAIIPFFVVVLISIPLTRSGWQPASDAAKTAFHRIRFPAITLVGALIMVELMMDESGDREAMTLIIGSQFAEITGSSWQYFATTMGALGSFFSGSASVSNLTFGAIQESIAQQVGLDPVRVLALQSVGAAMGNMVCINNIVAVCTILGIQNKEGFILARTAIPLLIYAIIAALACFII